uniref:Uncharacterized protein n=1 Tax=Tanacetum cinerariifolium TaxID=118510 RepID=A0A699GTX6_TANCI|nr:hypothetical protein [Tanacetum cinerariifolium]
MSSSPPHLLSTMERFATMVENVSWATTKDVPSAGQTTASPVEGEKNTNPMDAKPNLHDELVDLLGIDVVTQYYNKMLLYDQYCDKMLKRRKSSKITNCDVKENQEKDKIGSKPDKNGKRGEAWKNKKQLQSREKEK